MDFAGMIQNIPYLLIGLLGFGILVIWHELGHFLFAKLHDVQVDEFSVGMGKRLFGVKAGETEYNIRMLPIGGYVKMLGEEDDSSNPRALCNKADWKRLTIVLAGPVFNFILAIGLFACYYSNVGTPIPEIEKFVDNMPAVASGLKEGDVIIQADDKKISTWTDFSYYVTESEGRALDIKVDRDGDIFSTVITPKLVEENGDSIYMVGIQPVYRKLPLMEGLKYGVLEVKSSVKMTFGFFGKIVKGKADKKDVGGPVAIFGMATNFAKLGILPLVFLLAYISTQLAIFNILPIPALDGGWIVMLLLQMISGKKIDSRVVEKINGAGLLFLLTLMALVTIKDIIYM